MPRKRKEQPDNFNKAFPTVMRKLMSQKGTTQNELADYLQKTRQSVSYYCDGSSSPDWETIVKIANFFDVSIDYLLGTSETQTKDVDIQSIVKRTGLSEKSLAYLSSLKYAYNATTLNSPETPLNLSTVPIDAINLLIENEQEYHVLYKIAMYLLSKGILGGELLVSICQSTSSASFYMSSDTVVNGFLADAEGALKALRNKTEKVFDLAAFSACRPEEIEDSISNEKGSLSWHTSRE